MRSTKTQSGPYSLETRMAKHRELNRNPKLMSVPEAAAELRVGRSKMWKLVWSGEVKSVFVGHARRIVVASLNAYIEGLKGQRD